LGNFNLNPAPGEALIPRNLGEGPGFFSVNLRISKTWSFGDLPGSRAANQGGGQDGQRAGGPRGGGAGVPRIAGVGGGRGSGGPRGGGGFPGGGGAEGKRYSMQFSINFNNLLNHVNLATPVGNLSSPSFGESLSLGGTFGGFGGGGGSGGNRRVSLQLRFNF
jgi:hypothetical protein